MDFLKGLLPNKYLLIGALVLFTAMSGLCGYLYLTKQVTDANYKTLQVELNEANKRVETQKTTIALMAKDAQVQADLLKQYQVSVTEIRKIAADKLIEIADTDYGKEAASNASELEKTVNDRMQMLFNNISQLSQGK